MGDVVEVPKLATPEMVTAGPMTSFGGTTTQPDRGWVLVNKETIVMTDPAEQVFRTELLGYGVDVVATPTSYRYDFGDDSDDLVTDSPGHSYPDHDTFHFYTTLGTCRSR